MKWCDPVGCVILLFCVLHVAGTKRALAAGMGRYRRVCNRHKRKGELMMSHPQLYSRSYVLRVAFLIVVRSSNGLFQARQGRNGLRGCRSDRGASRRQVFWKPASGPSRLHVDRCCCTIGCCYLIIDGKVYGNGKRVAAARSLISE